MSRSTAFAALVIVVFGGGYWMGKASSPDSKELQHLKQSLADLEQHELQEYRELKGQSEKLKKADELLEKIMSLFLLDLGQRFKKAETPPPYTPPKEREPEVAEPTPQQDQPILQSEKAPPTKPPPPAVHASPPSALQQNAELERDGANEFLKKHRQGDFGSTLNDSFRPEKNDALFLSLNGKYLGVVSLTNPSAVWSLNFELNGKPWADRYSGTASVILLNGSKRIAWRKEQNSISMLRRSSPGSPWLILEISEYYYAELFFRDSNRSFVGNFYEKKGPDQFVHRGTVDLFPRE